MPNVFIPGSSPAYEDMMQERGWDIIHNISEADLVLFTGGADVDPSLYGEKEHPRTFTNTRRDQIEAELFEYAKEHNIPCAGICRGGQLLNVLNGGKMYQDVSNHAIYGSHKVYDLVGRESIPVSSTHHQMMRPAGHGRTLAVADSLSPEKEHMVDDSIVVVTDDPKETEAVLYKDTKSLCFQPHPEFNGFEACRNLFFSYLKLLGV